MKTAYHVETDAGKLQYLKNKIKRGTNPAYVWMQRFISLFDRELTPMQRNIQELEKEHYNKAYPIYTACDYTSEGPKSR